MGRFRRWLYSAPVLRVGTGLLRRVAPTVRLGGRVIVTRHADVVDALARQAELSVVPVYAARMEKTSGAFFLGMDDGEVYQRESTLLRRAVRPGDLERVRTMAGDHARAIVDAAAAAGRIDAVDQLTREVPIRLLGDYFGVPARDGEEMRRWMRQIFSHLFFNLDASEPLKSEAEAAAVELNAYVDDLVARCEPGQAPATMLARLVAAGELDPVAIRRNLNGLIIGSVDTVSKAATLALRVLLGRPRELAGAREAARAGDHDRLLQFIYEALRFDPFNPFMFRVPARETTVGQGGKPVTPDDQILVSPLAAMFDPRAFEAPGEFRTDRLLSSYLHFGFGLHECFGSRMNRVTLPAILGPLLARERLRPLGSVEWAADDQFPDHWHLELA